MSRYLRTVKSAPAGRVPRIGALPKLRRIHIDYVTWHARLAGANGRLQPTTIAAQPATRREQERRAA